MQIDRSFDARRTGCGFMCKTGAEDRMRMICVKRVRSEQRPDSYVCNTERFGKGRAAFEPSDLQNSDFGGRRHDDDRKKRQIS